MLRCNARLLLANLLHDRENVLVCQMQNEGGKRVFGSCGIIPGMSTYRLVATDLDGTLFGHDMVISPRTRRALASLAERDCHLVLATGRMFRATVPVARELSIVTPLVTYQGALIRHMTTLEDAWHRTLPADLAAEALEALEEAGFHINLYVNDELHLKHLTPEAQSYISLARVEHRLCGSWAEAMAAMEPTKIVGIGPEEKVAASVVALKARFGDRLFITQSQPTFLEIAHPSVNKGAAVAHLAEQLGIPREQVVAVGDGMNDLDMIEYAGLGVAMGQGHPELRARARRVTRPLAEDGVACLIEDLIAEGSL